MKRSMKDVPEDVVHCLRAPADRNHRSLQVEPSAVIEAAAREPQAVRKVWAEIQRRGLSSPADSAAIVRADRGRDDEAHHP